jgi:hypothetical protein
MMKYLAPAALTGIVGVILWRILEILMAPIVAWILGVLAVGLKVGLALALTTAAFYVVRRVIRDPAGGESGAAE